MKKLFAALAAAACCTMIATPCFADAGTTGVKAAASCQTKQGAALKSCCENLTFNQSTEAKERREAAVCVKTVMGKKTPTKEKAAPKS
jgi:hypothetical protein